MNEMIPPSARAMGAGLVTRLMHDLAGSATGLVTGLDLISDPEASEFKSDALALIEESGRNLVSMIEFYRMAYGAPDSVNRSGRLEALARGQVSRGRGTLDWRVDAQRVSPVGAKLTLLLTQLLSPGLAAGAIARIETSQQEGALTVIAGISSGTGRVSPEAITGLERGLPPPGSPQGLWALGSYISEVVAEAGGAISIEAVPFRIIVRLPE